MISLGPAQYRTKSGKIRSYGQGVIKYRGRTIAYVREGVPGTQIAFVVERREVPEAVIAEIEKRLWEHDQAMGHQPRPGFKRRMMFLPE